ncbi:hypothetical protein NEIMUCOT_05647 [Neisseria mucosa ATCC 25996]|uniref:Uncharacterized protein n=1 Tax=Neisseria mucosa (strain ATCC 25996 / DSM 4631 / NCTC 10774 / M26) TaxID=546266 RepID=D2ZYD8_NEIM2|nr:hypothetical protein NEIMUCOT_05647 [Neisseria mucosa ATCC 25996]
MEKRAFACVRKSDGWDEWELWFEPINRIFEKMWIILNITFPKKQKGRLNPHIHGFQTTF